MLLNLCDFRENRLRKGHNFMAENDITLIPCSMKPYDILEVKKSLANSVYHATHYTIRSLVSLLIVRV
jgi:hypothetical protein